MRKPILRIKKAIMINNAMPIPIPPNSELMEMDEAIALMNNTVSSLFFFTGLKPREIFIADISLQNTI